MSAGFDQDVAQQQRDKLEMRRQGLKIACLEEIALAKGFIDAAQMGRLVEASGKNEYAQYLRRVLAEYQDRDRRRLGG